MQILSSWLLFHPYTNHRPGSLSLRMCYPYLVFFYFYSVHVGRGGLSSSSCLELKREKSEDIENNINMFSRYKNILEEYIRNCRQLSPLKKTRELERLSIIYPDY